MLNIGGYHWEENCYVHVVFLLSAFTHIGI